MIYLSKNGGFSHGFPHGFPVILSGCRATVRADHIVGGRHGNHLSIQRGHHSLPHCRSLPQVAAEWENRGFLSYPCLWWYIFSYLYKMILTTWFIYIKWFFNVGSTIFNEPWFIIMFIIIYRLTSKINHSLKHGLSMFIIICTIILIILMDDGLALNKHGGLS